jgi:hypothetical protein
MSQILPLSDLDGLLRPNPDFDGELRGKRPLYFAGVPKGSGETA